MIWFPWIVFAIGVSSLIIYGFKSKKKSRAKLQFERQMLEEQKQAHEKQMAQLLVEQEVILTELRQQRKSQAPVSRQGYVPDLADVLGERPGKKVSVN